MSWLNYILVVLSIGAIIYSYSVGSTFGIVIWIIVFGLNLALIIVERLKRKALVPEEEIPESP
jgi:cytochrome c biogenesis protein CcdA